MNGSVIKGSVRFIHSSLEDKLGKRDAFYLPGGQSLEIEALEDCVIFIGGGLFEGKGMFLFVKYDLSLPLGNIHQVHGKPPFQREVL